MDRKLASIQVIDEINPIFLAENNEPAENIEQAVIGGWRLIVKRNEFQVGDKCVFLEVDSILPETEWSEFLRSRKFKIGTLKFNKFLDSEGRIVISQGLALPVLTCYPATSLDWFEVGEDVTEQLGVTKYEPPVKFYQGNARGNFPTNLVPKTDETRIQSCMGVLEEINGLPVYVTMKLDGSSGTYFFDAEEDKLRVCSRNLEKSFDENDLWWKIAIKYNLENKLRNFPNIAIQGEICGPNIQNNLLGLSDYEFYVFNVFDIKRQGYASYPTLKDTCETLDLKMVPVLYEQDEFDMAFEDIKQFTDGAIYPGTNNPLEGVVIRPQEERYSKVLGGRMSFKYINVSYSLKYGG